MNSRELRVDVIGLGYVGLPLRLLFSEQKFRVTAALFGDELLNPIGVLGIWFPFGIGVSRTQYVYAIAIPLLAILIVRTLTCKENTSTSDTAMLRH